MNRNEVVNLICKPVNPRVCDRGDYSLSLSLYLVLSVPISEISSGFEKMDTLEREKRGERK